MLTIKVYFYRDMIMNKSEYAAEGREHVWCFDYLRSIALFFVIFMHVAAGPLRIGMSTGWYVLDLCVSIAFTAVPLFFMMSGYLLMTDERTSDVSFLIKYRLPKLIITLAAWSVIAAAWSSWINEYDMSLFAGNILDALHKPAWVHLWYMYTLIGLYIISPMLYAAIHGMNASGRKYLLALVIIVCLQGFIYAAVPGSARPDAQLEFVSDLRFFGGHITSFILGYCLGTMKKRINNALLVIIALLDTAFITLGTWRDTVSVNEYSGVFQSQSSGPEILLAACIFIFFKQNLNRDSRVRRAVSPLVSLSLGIYLIHNFLLSYMHVYIWRGETAKHVLPVTAAILVISYIIVKTLATIPVISYALAGLPFRSACSSCNWVFTFKKVFSIFRHR